MYAPVAKAAPSLSCSHLRIFTSRRCNGLEVKKLSFLWVWATPTERVAFKKSKLCLRYHRVSGKRRLAKRKHVFTSRRCNQVGSQETQFLVGVGNAHEKCSLLKSKLCLRYYRISGKRRSAKDDSTIFIS